MSIRSQFLSAVLITACVPATASATWSIVVLDRATQSIQIAVL